MIGEGPIYLYGCPKFQLIHEGNEEVTNISWSLEVKSNDGVKSQIIAAQTDGKDWFVVNNSSLFLDISPENIEQNEGVAQFIVIAKTKLNGVPISKQLSLPMILTPYVSEPRYHISSQSIGEYDLTFEIDYAGNCSPWIYVTVEYEFDTTIKKMGYNCEVSPYCQTLKLLEGYDIWIDIQLSNKFGDTVKTIELLKDLSGIKNTYHDNNEITGIKVYGVQGTYLGSFNNISEISGLTKGVYIIEELSSNKTIRRTKYLSRPEKS